MKFPKLLFTKQPPIATAPPVSPLGNVVRWAFIVIAGLSAFMAVTYDNSVTFGSQDWRMALELPGLALALYLYVNRRTLPVAAAWLIPLASWVSSLSVGAVILVAVSLGTRGKWRELFPNAVLLVLGSLAPVPRTLSGFYFDPTAFIYGPLLLVPVYAIGIAIGFNRKESSAKRAWARSEDLLQVSRVQEIRALERTAIAREMHDVLAHRISMVALHSGALAYRSDMEPEQIKETAQTINDNARLALKELREVLGTLREEGSIGDEAEAPQPTLGNLPRLWEEANAAVAPVSVAWHGLSPESVLELQDSTSRNAYRVIQESLTNARKHAPGVPVQVNLGRTDPRFLTVAVVNRILPNRPMNWRNSSGDHLSGFGLIGMAERVRSSGGTIAAGPQGDQFVVSVSLPWITKEQGL